jgi:hypothetical protein
VLLTCVYDVALKPGHSDGEADGQSLHIFVGKIPPSQPALVKLFVASFLRSSRIAHVHRKLLNLTITSYISFVGASALPRIAEQQCILQELHHHSPLQRDAANLRIQYQNKRWCMLSESFLCSWIQFKERPSKSRRSRQPT